jgi:hypothetical protein
VRRRVVVIRSCGRPSCSTITTTSAVIVDTMFESSFSSIAIAAVACRTGISRRARR